MKKIDWEELIEYSAIGAIITFMILCGIVILVGFISLLLLEPWFSLVFLVFLPGVVYYFFLE